MPSADHYRAPVRLAAALSVGYLGIQLLIRVVTGFEGLYGQDSYAYFDYATGPLLAALSTGRPFPGFHWPPGYPLLVAAATMVIGPSPWSGQLVSMVAGAVVVAATVLLAHELYGRRAARLPLVAGLIVMMVPQLWQSSQAVMSDTAGLAWATLGMWLVAGFGRRPGRGIWLWLAAAALAAAVLTRWVYALVALPALLYAIIVLARGPWRRSLILAIGSAATGLLVLSPVLPTVLSALAGEARAEQFAVDLVVYRWAPANALERHFVTADGFQSYRHANGVYYLLAPAHRYYLTAWLAPLLLPGVVWLTRRRLAAAGLILGGWAALSVALLAGGAWQNFRFSLAHLPPLAIGVAAGWHAAVAALPAPRRWLATAYLATGLALMGAGGVDLTRSFAARHADHVAMVRWVEAQVPPDALLVTFQLTSTFRHESALAVEELFSLDSDSLPAALPADRPAYLLIDVANVTSQWAGRSPARNLRWLEANRRLDPVGSRGGYTLFAVAR